MYFFSWLLLRKITTNSFLSFSQVPHTCMETAWQLHLILTWYFFFSQSVDYENNRGINIPRHIASAMSSSISHSSSLLLLCRQEPISAWRSRAASSVIKRTNTNEYHTVPILFKTHPSNVFRHCLGLENTFPYPTAPSWQWVCLHHSTEITLGLFNKLGIFFKLNFIYCSRMWASHDMCIEVRGPSYVVWRINSLA